MSDDKVRQFRRQNENKPLRVSAGSPDPVHVRDSLEVIRIFHRIKDPAERQRIIEMLEKKYPRQS